MNKIIKPRGTLDYFFNIDPSFDIILNMAKMVASLNGYYEIKTPIFEHEELFVRSIGESSDIVHKEFYQFKDKSDRKLVLRPEQTASIARAIIENNLLNNSIMPLKYFYCGPMFRYERPQSGRLRQFYQFGIECIGTKSYCDDVDTLLLAKSILDAFNLKKYIININNICSFETRAKWIAELKKYFTKFKDQLTEDSINRLNTNPLRILDDKIDGKKQFVIDAPKISLFATDEEKKYFTKITNLLDVMKIDYKINETLVRGLDYYSNFIFEIESTSDCLKGQPTLIGGGRYNNLINELGGKDLPCVGFAFGIERLIIALNDEKLLDHYKNQYVECDVVIANLTETTNLVCLILARMLRLSSISCIINFNSNKLDKHFKYAEANKANFVIILGEKELKEQKIVIKNQITLKQEIVDINDLVEYIKNNSQRKKK